ncbi:uncharacterized protein LOC134270327 [Saccostrea cucullata]|uniref:uncharacterized protein LOC134270327 n=1 Tax=Saccostrea cuccullata TaxID=36930 RepID=UPI002ED4D098
MDNGHEINVLGQIRKDNKRKGQGITEIKASILTRRKVLWKPWAIKEGSRTIEQKLKNAPNSNRGRHGTTRYDRRSKVTTQPIINHRPGITAQVDITQAVTISAVCNECKRKDTTQQTSISTGDGPGTGGLGDQYCYFCKYYRLNMTNYNNCRDRFCASGYQN